MAKTYILIKDNQPQGFIDGDPSQVSLGSEYKVVGYEGNKSFNALYYADERLQEKPEQPSEEYVWSDTDLKWIKPEVKVSVIPNFKGFYQELIASNLYSAILNVGSKSLKKNIATTGFLTSLSVVDNTDSFESVLKTFIVAAENDLGQGEMTVLRRLCEKHNLPSPS